MKFYNYEKNLSEEDVPEKVLKNLKISKTGVILAKVFLGIMISLLIIVGGIWFVYKNSTPLEKNYGTLIENDTNNLATYQFLIENFQISFPEKPKSKLTSADFFGKEYSTSIRTFSSSDDTTAFQVTADSLKEIDSGELQTPTLEEVYDKYTVLESSENISIVSETENSITFDTKDFGTYYSRKAVILEKDFVYYLSASSRYEEDVQEKWLGFFNSFELIRE